MLWCFKNYYFLIIHNIFWNDSNLYLGTIIIVKSLNIEFQSLISYRL